MAKEKMRKFEGTARELPSTFLGNFRHKGPSMQTAPRELKPSDGKFSGEKRSLSGVLGEPKLEQKTAMKSYIIVFKAVGPAGAETVLRFQAELPEDSKPTSLDVWPAEDYDESK